MDKDSDAFSRRLLATFKGEAEEHIRVLGAGFMEMERGGGAVVVETVFREVHSLKGAARAVGQADMESLCQSVESVLAALKSGTLGVGPALLDLLHRAVDTLAAFLAALDGELPHALVATANALRRGLAGAAGGAAAHPPAETPTPPPEVAAPTVRAGPPPPDSLRVEVSRLDAVLFEAEALVGARLAARQHEADLASVRQAFALRRREWTKVRPDYLRLRRGRQRERREAGLDSWHGLVDYLSGEDAFLRNFGARLQALHETTQRRGRSLSGMVDSLLGDMKKLLLVPLGPALEGVPRLVRDLARELGKEVEFQVSGAELEIDRRILEELRDPLVHLVRNCVDHGVETPEARLAAGKPRRGGIRFAASAVDGGRIELQIADDGAGIDLGKVRAAARQLGLQPPADGDRENAWLLSQVFRSGLSTSPFISEISGRGLGLAIVREKVERLGGTVTLASTPGQGCRFHLLLPVALASFHGVRVRAAGQEFIFPSAGVGLVARVPRDKIRTVASKETVSLAGRAVALVRLADVLELTGAAPGASLAVVTVGSGEERVAFAVDAVVDEQEVLVKNLGRQLRRVRNIAGATVLGSGQVVPILHLPDLLASARRMGPAAPRPAAAAAPPAEEGAPVLPPVLLVAEDSITSRLLLKGILEAAGYRVLTAADGAEAWTRLRIEAVDLLVSDVDMPRLNGFELTARIRADPRLMDLPVVLVTGLDKREDRERGAEAGASAYIVKSSFEQGDLLAALRRLL